LEHGEIVERVVEPKDTMSIPVVTRRCCNVSGMANTIKLNISGNAK